MDRANSVSGGSIVPSLLSDAGSEASMLVKYVSFSFLVGLIMYSPCPAGTAVIQSDIECRKEMSGLRWKMSVRKSLGTRRAAPLHRATAKSPEPPACLAAISKSWASSMDRPSDMCLLTAVSSASDVVSIMYPFLPDSLSGL